MPILDTISVIVKVPVWIFQIALSLIQEIPIHYTTLVMSKRRFRYLKKERISVYCEPLQLIEALQLI